MLSASVFFVVVVVISLVYVNICRSLLPIVHQCQRLSAQLRRAITYAHKYREHRFAIDSPPQHVFYGVTVCVRDGSAAASTNCAWAGWRVVFFVCVYIQSVGR